MSSPFQPSPAVAATQATHATQWGTQALWSQLAPLLPGLSIEVVAHSASTNTALIERARASTFGNAGPALVRRSVESGAFGRRASDAQPCLLVAESQSRGRGRQGRRWHSAPGASLTFSLSLPLRLEDWSGLSLAVGVALCEALPSPQGAPRLGIKWPNDLWLIDGDATGRKLGGILIETLGTGAGASGSRVAVIGVGLNVTPLPDGKFTTAVSTGLASVCELDPAATPPNVLARIALPLAEALQRFDADGFSAFIGRFAALDVLAGRAVQTTHALAPKGEACGVSADGALRVRTAAGIVNVASGEVSVRPLAEPLAPASPLPPATAC